MTIAKPALLLAALLALLAWGCGKATDEGLPPEVAGKTSAVKDPPAMLHEQLRSGSVQLQGVVETLTEAQGELATLLKSAKSDQAESLRTMQDMVDSAADAAAEFGVDPPAEKDIKAGFAKYDEQRLKAISELNDAYVDLTSVTADASSIAEADGAYQALSELLILAKKDFAKAIQAMGGQVEEEEDPDSAPPSPAPGP